MHETSSISDINLESNFIEMRIAHFVNVVDPLRLPPKSDLHIAQPITLDSMVLAKNLSAHDIELYAVKHRSELVQIPNEFILAKDFNRYCYDVFTHLPKIKHLPLIGDIFNSMNLVKDVDYFIYTNVDIGVVPSFYDDVIKYLKLGFKGLMINRRTMPTLMNNRPFTLNNYYSVFSNKGKYHPGCDCFVFPKNILNKINLGNVFIGFPPVAAAIEFCLRRYIPQDNFIWLNRNTYHKTFTFHFGDPRPYYNNRIRINRLYRSCNSLAYQEIKKCN